MVRRVFPVFVWSTCTLACAAVSAQQWAQKMFETTTHDFGTIARGAKAEYEFVLSNIYLEDVHIASARPSCGCTSVKIKNPHLKTYEKGAIVASINSRTFLGRQGAAITVTLDKPFYARVRLRVKVYVRSDVVLDPPSVNLGSVDQGTPAEKKVSVTFHGSGDWKILDVKSSNPHLSGEMRETARDQRRVAYEIDIRLGEHAPSGYVKDHLMLVTNDRRSTQIPVPVEGRVLAPITVSPASLFMGVVRSGEKITKQVIVRSKKPFRIVAIKADCDCFQFAAPAQEAPKPVHVVPITFEAGRQPGKVVKTIRIETDFDDAAVELSTYAVVKPE